MAVGTGRHAGGRPRTIRRCPLGLRIERLADDRGLHIDEVAATAGIAKATLYRILTGGIASPRLATVQAIAAAFGVTVDRLLAVEPPKKRRRSA
jgi:transcriptional regulator with XRE-family HTH domain